MAKVVSGFLANDGNFFISEAEADLHNAEMQIQEWCESHKVDPDKVVQIIEALADPIKDYLRAKEAQEANIVGEKSPEGGWYMDRLAKAAQTRETFRHDHTEPEPAVEEDQADEDGLGEAIDAILEQQIDGHEPVPDVGSGTQPEGVQHEREGNGSRSGFGHARSLRGSTSVAALRAAGIS